MFDNKVSSSFFRLKTAVIYFETLSLNFMNFYYLNIDRFHLF